MNNIIASAIYKGDITTPNGLPTMHLEIPSSSKNNPPIPIFLLAGYAAKETSIQGAFPKGSNLLLNARLFPHSDGSMYTVPTSDIQLIPPNVFINQVFLAGGVGYITSKFIAKLNKEVTDFGLMCKSVQEKRLGISWKDSLPFKIESWDTDARRLKQFLYEGRQIALGGTIKFETYTDKEGKKQAKYKMRVRSSQYSFFGKNEKDVIAQKELIETVRDIVKENQNQPQVYESPHQQAIADSKGVNWQSSPVVPENDDVPF